MKRYFAANCWFARCDATVARSRTAFADLPARPLSARAGFQTTPKRNCVASVWRTRSAWSPLAITDGSAAFPAAPGALRANPHARQHRPAATACARYEVWLGRPRPRRPRPALASGLAPVGYDVPASAPPGQTTPALAAAFDPARKHAPAVSRSGCLPDGTASGEFHPASAADPASFDALALPRTRL